MGTSFEIPSENVAIIACLKMILGNSGYERGCKIVVMNHILTSFSAEMSGCPSLISDPLMLLEHCLKLSIRLPY